MKVERKIGFFNGLAGRSIVAISLLIIVIGLILSMFFTSSQERYMQEGLINNSRSLVNNLAYNVDFGTKFNDSVELIKFIEGVMTEQDIVYAYVVDTSGYILGHSDSAKIGSKQDISKYSSIESINTSIEMKDMPDFKEQVIEVMSPILYDRPVPNPNEEQLFSQNSENRDIIGYAVLGVSTSSSKAAISELQQKAFIITIGIILSGIFITILLVQFITKPIHTLMDATQIVAEGNLDHKVVIGRNDEIGVLANSFNEMIGRLKLSRQKVENWNKDLEVKVFDRTRAINEKNIKLKRYSEELKKAYDELMILDKAKDDFLALVSHELRTPLSSIVAYTEVLMDDMADTEEEEKNYLDIIKNESDRLTRLINDVLDLSKMEVGRMPFEFKDVGLSEIVNTGVKGVASVADKHGHKIINKVENSSTVVVADFDKINQVLSNILSNAIKFTPEGGKITIAENINKTKVQISISDSGRGIKKEDFDKVFDKFQQIENVDYHSEGTGLGMPISKIIIENHKGKIWFDSEPDKGTTFHFTLPLSKESVNSD